MELTMALQEDSTPWIPPPAVSASQSDSAQHLLNGRSYFSSLGQVRRKPSRPDAPPTISKSCTDKLCLKQCTSLLSSTTSLLVSPRNLYLNSLILPASQISEAAMIRAFSPEGRMEPLTRLGMTESPPWQDAGYAFRPMKIRSTRQEFRHSRRQQLLSSESLVSSNISAAWTPHFCETLIGGTVQGRKQFSMRGASRVCKRRTWKLALDIATTLGERQIHKALNTALYRNVKTADLLHHRRSVMADVREILGNWIKNDAGDDFGVCDVES